MLQFRTGRSTPSLEGRHSGVALGPTPLSRIAPSLAAVLAKYRGQDLHATVARWLRSPVPHPDQPKRSDPKPSLPPAAVDHAPEPSIRHRPIRVLVVTASFLPDLGGIETHVYEVTRRLVTRGDLDITVLTTDRSGTRPVTEKYEGVKVLRCRSYPKRRDYYLAPAIYRHIRGNQYDLVHCQGIHTAVPILAMLAARRNHIPYVVTFHTGGHSSGFRQRIRAPQWRALSPLLRSSALLVAVSRFEQRMFQRACGLDEGRFRIVQNGGDLPTGVGRADIIPGRIISSGRLERYKGHQRVIEALPIVRESIPGATVHILGSGPYERQLRSLINRLGLTKCVTIEFVPPNDRARMAQTLGTAGALAALSEYEAHPVAVMEALALGVPTVGLDTAGIGDLIEDGRVEGVPRDASPETIARTLVAALEGRHVSSPSSLPTWDLAASDLARIYREAIRTSPEPSSPGKPRA
jgi:glycosyltransferase involved in cell wall biosynthesis